MAEDEGRICIFQLKTKLPNLSPGSKQSITEILPVQNILFITFTTCGITFTNLQARQRSREWTSWLRNVFPLIQWVLDRESPVWDSDHLQNCMKCQLQVQILIY